MKKLLYLLALVLIPFIGNASHVIGGSITWECQANGQYVFKMEVFRDCWGIDLTFQNEIIDIVGSPLPRKAGGSVFSTITMVPDQARLQNSNNGDTSPDCDGVGLNCSNGDFGTIQEFYYTSAPVTLSGVPPATGWGFFWTAQCCRPISSATDNVNTTSGGGQMLLRAEMFPDQNNSNAYPCFDSSPQFVNKPVPYVCRSIENSYSSHVAIDNDLDSLVHKLGQPFDAPINNPFPLTYKIGYSPTNPTPDTAFNVNNIPSTLNSETGLNKLAIFSGNGSRKYLIVSSVDAYKNGHKVASVYREYPISVFDCARLANGQQNRNPQLSFNGNDSNYFELSVQAGQLVTIPISVTDMDSNARNMPQVVRLTANGTLFSPTNQCTSNIGNCARLMNDSLTFDPLGTVKYKLEGRGGVNTNFVWQTDCDLLGANGEEKSFYFYFNVQDDHCPVPGTNAGVINVTVTPKVVNSKPFITCLSQNANSYLINWDISQPIVNFKQWVIVGKTANGTDFVRLDSITTQTSRTISVLKTGTSQYTDFQVHLEFTMCGSKTFIKKSENRSLKTDLDLLAENSGLKLTWNNFGGIGRNLIYVNIDSGGFHIVDSVLSNITSYTFEDSICYSTVSFYISNALCSAFSDTVHYSDPSTSINLSATSSIDCLQLTWSLANGDRLFSPPKTYIYLKIDSGKFELIDSVQNTNTYCLVDTFCYDSVVTQIKQCGLISNQQITSRNTIVSNINITTSVKCVNLNWSFPGLSPIFGQLKKFDILKSYNDSDYFKIAETRENQFCIVEDDCKVNAYYKVQAYRCNNQTNPTFNSGVHLPIDTSVQVIDNKIIVNQRNSAYFWYDCQADSIITDSIGSSFSPKDTGIYAAIIRRFQCQDTTACIPIFPVGLTENTFQNQISFFPNPTTGLININLSNPEAVKVEVRNIQGQLVQNEDFQNTSNIELGIKGKAGIYFIQLTNEKGERANLKVVKQ